MATVASVGTAVRGGATHTREEGTGVRLSSPVTRIYNGAAVTSGATCTRWGRADTEEQPRRPNLQRGRIE